MWSLGLETALPCFLQRNSSVFLFLDLRRPWKWTFKCIWVGIKLLIPTLLCEPKRPNDLFVSNNLQRASLNYLGEAENFCSVATYDLKKLHPCWMPWLSFPNFSSQLLFLWRELVGVGMGWKTGVCVYVCVLNTHTLGVQGNEVQPSAFCLTWFCWMEEQPRVLLLKLRNL